MQSKNHCHYCGAILALIIVAAEATPIVCHECGHVDAPHVSERGGFTHELLDSSVVTVSGISSTLTADTSSFSGRF